MQKTIIGAFRISRDAPIVYVDKGIRLEYSAVVITRCASASVAASSGVATL